MFRKERPIVRKILESMMSDYGWSTSELREFTSYDPSDVDWQPVFCLSSSMKIQLRKMIEEEQQGFF